MPSKKILCSAAIFLISFVVLAWNINALGISAAYSDPIDHVRAQDEAIYVNSAIRMTQDGDWMTPKFLGRLLLYKPPLLMWMAAACIRVFGLSLFAVRLPALLMGAAGVAAVFGNGLHAPVPSRRACWLPLCCCPSPFWQTFRDCQHRRTRQLFGAAGNGSGGVRSENGAASYSYRRRAMATASILAKSIGGLLPFAALVLYVVLIPGEERPKLGALAETLLIAGLVLIPWHLYEALVYPKWFWADYVEVELLGLGIRPQRTGRFWYYVRRLVQMDPVALVMGVIGIAGVFRFKQFRKQPAVLLAHSWAFITVAALCAYQSINLSLRGVSAPVVMRAQRIVPAEVRGSARLAGPLRRRCAVRRQGGGPWITLVPLRPATPPMEGARAMREYYSLHRDAELILVDPDDSFYDATIPLPHVRYCAYDPANWVPNFGPHYVPLGITLTAQQFADLPKLQPEFEKRLREWGVNSPEPIGTTTTVHTLPELAIILRCVPGQRLLFAHVLGIVAGRRGARVPARSVLSRSSVSVKPTAGQRKPPVPSIPAHW